VQTDDAAAAATLKNPYTSLTRAAAAFVLAAALLPVTIFAEDLSVIQSRISELETSLADKEVEYGGAREAVLKIEQQLHAARKENSALQSRLEEKMQHIGELRTERAVMNERYAASVDIINAVLRSRYKQSRVARLKIVLNNDNVSSLQRKLKYYDYLTEAGNERVAEQSERVAQIQQLESALKLEATKLRRIRGDSEAQLISLNKSFDDRARLAKSLEELLRENKDALAELRRDEHKLTDLVEEVADDNKNGPLTRKQFGGLKGALEWPTIGRIAKAPGSAMRDGGAKWSGVIIESKPGSDVMAVSGGRVAFADWFRNLGLLVIIDHGDGYMSLYGHNSELYASAGDTVEEGDVVAAVGDTGGRISSGLYFEIRENGTPRDPRMWCKK